MLGGGRLPKPCRGIQVGTSCAVLPGDWASGSQGFLWRVAAPAELSSAPADPQRPAPRKAATAAASVKRQPEARLIFRRVLSTA